ncbi:NADH:flavin oxidoreductase [Isosphaeraceae bacterium EP7]
MSKYFKYKTVADLALDAERRGLTLRPADELDPLRRPYDLGGRRVGNRLAIQPMEGCDGTADGSPGELTLRRYERFGDGGAKLIWAEAAAIVPEARANTRQLVIDETHVDGLARLLDACRRAHRSAWGNDDDLVVGLQLTHSGRYSHPRPIIAQHDPLLDGRTMVDRATGTKVGPDFPILSDDELDRLQDRYVEAATLAYRCGFDFVDLKQCHRYLLNELLAAKTRPGKYGGPYEHRTRFIREVAGRIRDENPGRMIGTRLNIYDGIPFRTGSDGVGVTEVHASPIRSTWGTREDDASVPDMAEPIRLVGDLNAAGVTLFNLSMGNPYASPHIVRPFEYPPVDGYETPEHPLIGVDRHLRLSAEIQAAHPDVAIVGSGYSWLQAWAFHVGARQVAEGRATFVGLGRGSLSHPDFARHVMEDRPLDPKRTCRTFSDCTTLMRSKNNALGQFATGCPPFDKAIYGPILAEARDGR